MINALFLGEPKGNRLTADEAIGLAFGKIWHGL